MLLVEDNWNWIMFILFITSHGLGICVVHMYWFKQNLYSFTVIPCSFIN